MFDAPLVCLLLFFLRADDVEPKSDGFLLGFSYYWSRVHGFTPEYGHVLTHSGLMWVGVGVCQLQLL